MGYALLLLLAAPAAGATRCGPGLDRAAGALRTADAAAAHGDYRGAGVMLDRALGTLGGRYAPPETNDDTGMHLVLAGVEQRKGRLRQAVTIKRRVLADRIALCRQPGNAPPPR